MGRRKMVIKKIEDRTSRHVTFSKRRTGLMKKAKDFSVLCDVDVAVVIFSGSGKLYDFCSSSAGMDGIVTRYHSSKQLEGEECSEAIQENTRDSGGEGTLTIGKLLENFERVLEEPDIDKLSLNGLAQLEEQLQDALSQTRSKKAQIPMQSVAGLIEMFRVECATHAFPAKALFASKRRLVLKDHLSTNEGLGGLLKTIGITRNQKTLLVDVNRKDLIATRNTGSRCVSYTIVIMILREMHGGLSPTCRSGDADHAWP